MGVRAVPIHVELHRTDYSFMTISAGTTSQRMNRTTDEREHICAMSEDYKPELRIKITAETTIDDGHEERSSFTVSVKPLWRKPRGERL